MCGGVLHHTKFKPQASCVFRTKKDKQQKPHANPCVDMNARFHTLFKYDILATGIHCRTKGDLAPEIASIFCSDFNLYYIISKYYVIMLNGPEKSPLPSYRCYSEDNTLSYTLC